MKKTRKIKKEVCRLCLTHSVNVVGISEKLDKYSNMTILKTLEEVMSVQYNGNKSTPRMICSMCHGLLRIAYDLKVQFINSTKKLEAENQFDFTPNNTAKAKTDKTPEIKNKAPVEIIIGENKYDIKDLVIVEEENTRPENYSGFLNNLGSTISAKIVNKDYQYTNAEPETDVLIIENRKNTEHPEQPIIVEILKENSESNYLDLNECIQIDNEDSDLVDQFIIDLEKVKTKKNAPVIITDIFGDEYAKTISNEKQKDLFESAINYKYACECGKCFNSKARYDKHVMRKGCKHKPKEIKLTHDDQVEDATVVYQCNNCTATYKSEIYYLNHLRVCSDNVSGKPINICPHCKVIFTLKEELVEHIKLNHAEKTYQCDKCEYLTNSRSSAAHHKLTHGGKKHTCEICGKSFLTKSSLKNHAVTHTGKTVMLCPICGKGFNHRGGYLYHMRYHKNEKNYACKYCEKRFLVLNGLKRHVRTHTGIRPYSCSFCTKKFFSTGERKKHEFIHTGQKPYQCMYCKKGFRSSYNLKVHLMSHSGSFSCEHCEKSFIEFRFLESHLKSKHGLQITNISAEDNLMEYQCISDEHFFSAELDNII